MKSALLLSLVTTFLSMSAQYVNIRTGESQDFGSYQRTTPGFISAVYTNPQGAKLTNDVDTYIGTSGHGHTFPGATTPFGMVQISPDNGVYGWDWCSGYHYSRNDIVFFSHKHLSGTGATDLGDIGMMPFTGEYQFRHTYEHKNEYSRPGYYAVKLDNGILCEFTVTPRGAVHRYTFPEGADKKLRIDLTHNVNGQQNKAMYFEWLDDKHFAGYKNTNGWANNQSCYFIAEVSEPYKRLDHDSNQASIEFKGKSNVVEIRVALSTVSIENAKLNLESEIGNKSFEEIFAAASQTWEESLSKIAIEADSDIKTTFYTALYHAMIAPNLLTDVNGQFADPDNSVKTASGYNRYSTFSLWDTYRAAHSLFIFLKPDLVDDFVNSMLASYDYRGKLPIWELEANETFCMIGNHSIPVIAEAWGKNIRSFDKDKALKACVETATQDSRGLKDYIKMGYVPYNREGESVSKTLEYAYDDWAIARFAKAIGNESIAGEYFQRAENYKNLFDASTGLMRPKDSEGKWLKHFDQYAHKNGFVKYYTEGNAWQYTWSVQHDPEGLVALFGSKENFENQLDKLFVNKHEMSKRKTQIDVSGLIGQYAHGNEPSHHIAYLYNYSNNPWKTQHVVREICKTLYTDKPDGLCGNEDCGQMSAWYVFSALGFYPFDPVSGKYELGSPVVKEATFSLSNGKQFRIKAMNQSDENIFVEKVELNGQPLQGLQITHEQIMNGGELIFYMSNQHH